MTRSEKIKYLKEQGWHPVWTENYWSNTNCPDMGGQPVDDAYKTARQLELKRYEKIIDRYL